MLTLRLHYGLGAVRVARLRYPVGYDELAGADDATALIDRLLLPGAGRIAPGGARSLALCDRDALAAKLHTHLFGDDIKADTTCDACGKGYEVRFSLGALIQTRQPEMPDDVAAAGQPDWFCLPGGVTFRLPTQADVDAVWELEPHEAVAALRERQIRGGSDADPAQAEAAMRALCPLLDCDLDAPCPYCRTARSVRFSVTRYLERSLLAEQPLLLREVHCLARAYGWSHDAIMSLPRSERHAFVGLVTGEATASSLLRRSA